ncbi:efflux RND transporter periplasmic adaptor subunit [Aureliella helgolandensis]|uniref:Putative acetyl-CoA carboxylase biotin carboxyl carrier protein subunit n=1 Tax=Aureliella helgolandensis TaxID=2527968 RepID=A0A518G4I2_9BACT|nr:biotin/lipoyl-binding protein [Aureliella helgolandensis]QDV23507.1 putative acetyl-CoA carboxylase biotin carboxyl carrier protein subunit [Aureliella helgolandensis]
MDGTTSNLPPSGFQPDHNFAATAFPPVDGWPVENSAVASLDTPLLRQTKSEIRTLAAEIAQLAHSPVSLDEFFAGFLPRLCAAMGAKAAAAWRCPNSDNLHLPDVASTVPQPQLSNSAGSFVCIAEHAIPASLRDGTVPTAGHRRILECVVAEGQPVLVPPGNVSLEADRPNNPINDALIIVPVRIEESVAYLLEVVQRPAGGPTAQRGYLRFVAQMADLMSDYLRRQQLREYANERSLVHRVESLLVEVAGASSAQQRQQRTVDAVLELVDGEQAFLLFESGRPRVRAVSGIAAFDPRSQSILAAEELVGCLLKPPADPPTKTGKSPSPESCPPMQTLTASDRRQPAKPISGSEPHQRLIDAFCQSTGCQSAIFTTIDAQAGWSALVTLSSHGATEDVTDEAREARCQQVLQSLGAILAGTTRPAWGATICRKLLGIGNAQVQSRRQVAERWLMRAACVGLLFAVGLFPVSQNVTATATLHPADKQAYYAPLAGIVTEVLVSEGEEVTAGQILLRLTNRDLESQLDELQGERLVTRERIAEKNHQLSLGRDLTAQQSDQLEGELQQLRISEGSLSQQLEIVREQIHSLVVTAAADGKIASWDVRNRLLNRPIRAGDLLLTSFAPESPWALRIAIPDHRVGLVTDAMEASAEGVRVEFSLSSHPDQLCEGLVHRLAAQAVVDRENAPSGTPPQHVIYTDAVVSSAVLPLKKDGAIARASIHCGQVPAAWLVFRDAYLATRSSLQMLW